MMVSNPPTGVVDAGINLIDADERTPYPDVFVDAYNESKALAEKIAIEANGRNGLLTVALRPAGIFGYGSFIVRFRSSLTNTDYEQTRRSTSDTRLCSRC